MGMSESPVTQSGVVEVHSIDEFWLSVVELPRS
jgi:hypothetical protein